MHLGQLPATATFDGLLTTGSAWVLLAASLWAVALGLAATCEVCSSGRFRATTWVPCPAGLRRGVLTTLGLALAAIGAVTLPGTAVAAPATGRGGGPAALPVPERPSGSAAPTHTVPTHTVRAGDTLWAIAEARLHRPSAADVARLVDRIHEDNRPVIGGDPDHIVAGQHLALPQLPRPATPSTSTEENR